MSTNKTKATIALVLVLTITATFMAFLPVVNARDVTEETRIYFNLQPNPIGVGQTVTIGVWTYPIPPSSNERYADITVTMTKPDETTEVFGPAEGGPLGNWVWQYVPTATGTYEFYASWPGKTWYDINYGGILTNLTRLGDTSPTLELVVQQDPIEPFPDTPLPSEYWTYPINAQNYLWAGITGDQTHAHSPKTAHVLWTRQNAFGGIEGGIYGPVSYASGTMYEGKKSPNIIINGRVYQYGSPQISGAGDRYISSDRLLYCYDLATGEVLWSKEMSVSFAQIYEYNSVNQVGLHAYLWSTSGSTWSMYDAFDGDWIMDFENARSGTRIFEETYTTGEVGKGNILQYMINTQQGWMALWNFTKACDSSGRSDGVITYQSNAEKEQFGVYGGQWRPRSTAENDWMRGIEWNVSIPVEDFRMTSFSGISLEDGIGVRKTSEGNNKQMIYGFSLDPAHPGKLWGPVNLTSTYTSGFDVGPGVVILQNPTDMKFYGYNIQTGALKWTSDPGSFPWGSITDIGSNIFDGRLYSASYDGLHCYNITDGKELWLFTTGNAGVETPYGTWVARFSSTRADGDGKVYFNTGVWHPMPAYQRGDRLYCIDVKTGKNIWNYSGFWSSRPMANGYLIGLNEYDQRVYCFNKGPSKTTVSASPKVVAKGSNVLIEGTVTDQSPGSKDTPAISDQWMTPWMEYLYQQQPKPMDATGVPVELFAMASDGSTIDIGSVRSDIMGHFKYTWTPPAEDTYAIFAVFQGSDAYWTSAAETGLSVGPTPTAPSEPEPEAAADYTPMFAGIIAAVAVAIVIGIVNLYALRKQK